MSEKYVLFGAGQMGIWALEEIGTDKVIAFIDNDESKRGHEVSGIPLINLSDYCEKYNDYQILITSIHAPEMAGQLEAKGVKDYNIYMYRHKQYFPQDELLCDEYDKKPAAESEEEWNQRISEYNALAYIRTAVDHIGETPLFSHVEIETYNRCNGGCSFCPVSVKNESRPEAWMSRDLFGKIIDELSELDYDGRLAIFSNNEPFLDDRIIEFHKYAREKVPKARMHLFTNGSKLTVDKLLGIIPYLDELVIDNYNKDHKLTPSNQKIYDYCMAHQELISKVSIVIRDPFEILTSRGGDAPNRKEMKEFTGESCLFPFQQMIIRPDGKVSLCCNDPIGKCTMGDLNNQTMKEVWYGDEFIKARDAVRKGREHYQHCKYCDTFGIC